MKVKPQSKASQVNVPRKDPAKASAAPAPTPQQTKGWAATTAARGADQASLHASRRELSGHATHAAARVMAEHTAPPTAPITHKHPLLERFGETLGMGLGVIVTEALALVPSWNKPVLDAQGKPVAHVEGADRIGNHNILKRHEELVGPKITKLVDTLQPGMIHDLLEGLGKGATAAPGASYRLEAGISDMLHPKR